MRVLVVFLLAVLGCSLAEGGLVSKCELRDRLVTAVVKLSEKIGKKGELPVENLVAKIVCHVEKASGFNTSVVTQLTPRGEGHPIRGRREAPEGLFGLGEYQDPSVTMIPHTRARRDVRQPPAVEKEAEVWTLYGLFQLSNHLVCSDDDSNSSPNICGMDCDQLLDENTSDDITCVVTLIQNLLEKAFSMKPDLKRMIRLIFQEECRDTHASEFFSDCS